MRSELKDQLTAKDGQINGLVQEQAAMQSQLSEAQSQLQQVCPVMLHRTLCRTTLQMARMFQEAPDCHAHPQPN
jgi:hypothetical protein